MALRIVAVVQIIGAVALITYAGYIIKQLKQLVDFEEAFLNEIVYKCRQTFNDRTSCGEEFLIDKTPIIVAIIYFGVGGLCTLFLGISLWIGIKQRSVSICSTWRIFQTILLIISVVFCIFLFYDGYTNQIKAISIVKIILSLCFIFVVSVFITTLEQEKISETGGPSGTEMINRL